jgi:hypothetical protein
MSEETISAPDIAGSSSTPAVADSDRWDDVPVNTPAEGQNEVSEADNPSQVAKPKTEPKPAPEAKPEPPKPSLKKVKVDGKEELVDEDELLRTYAKAKGAEAKFREAAEMKKQVEQFMEAFKKDPLSLLMQEGLPVDRKSLGEKLLLAELEREMLTPEQRKLQEYEAKLKDFESKEQQIKREAEERETEQKREMKRQEISQMFTKAMEITPLSKAPETAQFAMEDMAKLMRIAKERGIEVGPEELAKHAESKYYKGMRALADHLDAKSLIEVLGPEITKKLRKHDLEQLKANTHQVNTHKNDSWASPEASQGKSTRVDPYEARERARKLLFGK